MITMMPTMGSVTMRTPGMTTDAISSFMEIMTTASILSYDSKPTFLILYPMLHILDSFRVDAEGKTRLWTGLT